MGPTVSTDAGADSVETSTSSSVSDVISFSAFCMSVKFLLKHWPTTGLWCHKLTSQLNAPCGQPQSLQPLRRAAWHNKTCNVLWLREDFVKAWRSLGQVTEGTSSSNLMLQQLRWALHKEVDAASSSAAKLLQSMGGKNELYLLKSFERLKHDFDMQWLCRWHVPCTIYQSKKSCKWCIFGGSCFRDLVSLSRSPS